ncbi:MAG: hypothetical protein MI743_01750 [Sneathiellales bacterium]|nr:hypothetical protein [Sneathiellales bacterium]
MLMSTKSQLLASVVLCLGGAYIWFYGVPFYMTALFTIFCILWAGMIFVQIFKGTDELKAAGIRYGLAAASGIGVPLSLACVMLMVAMPELQNVIAGIAAYSRSGIMPIAVGFGLGVTFMIILMCAVFAASHWYWWASKR